MIPGVWGGQGSRTGPGPTFNCLCGTGILVTHVSRFLKAGTNDYRALRCGDSPLCSSSCFPKDIGIVGGDVYRLALPYFSGRYISVCRAWAEGCSCSEVPFTILGRRGSGVRLPVLLNQLQSALVLFFFTAFSHILFFTAFSCKSFGTLMDLVSILYLCCVQFMVLLTSF